MSLSQLFVQLQDDLVNKKLTLTAAHGEGLFQALLFMLNIENMEIIDCSTDMNAGEEGALQAQLVISGNVTLPFFNGGSSLSVSIICKEKQVSDENSSGLSFSFSVHAVNRKFYEFFGPCPKTRCQEEIFLEEKESVLDNLTLKSVTLVTTSETVHDATPFSFADTYVSFEDNQEWLNYIWFSGLTAQVVDGWVFPPTQTYGNTPFLMRLKAQDWLLQFELDSWDGDLALCLESNLSDPEAGLFEEQSMAYVSLVINSDAFTTPISLSMPLFLGIDYWPFYAAFQNGFGVSDALNFASWLFGLNKIGWLFPQNTPLDGFKLYTLKGDLNVNGMDDGKKIVSLSRMQAMFSISKPWKLPIPKTSLDNLRVYWETTWGKEDDFLMTGFVNGILSIGVGDQTLRVLAGASLPDFEMEGHLIWSDEEWGTSEEPIQLSGLAGSFDAALPNEAQDTSLQLGRLDVYCSPHRRAISVQVEVDPGKYLNFNVGKLKITLDKIWASMNISPEKKGFALGGTASFGEDEADFRLSLSADYSASGGWLFEGGLSSGEVNLGKIVKLIDESAFQKMNNSFPALAGLSITDLYASYRTKSGTFTLTAGIKDSWPINDFPLATKIEANAFTYLEIYGDGTSPLLTVLFRVDLGMLKASMQVDDFFDNLNRKLIFSLEIGKLTLTASYNKKEVKDQNGQTALHEFLTVQLNDITFGDIVEALIQLVAPNRHSKLDAPWDILHKVSLSNAKLEFDVTDGNIKLTYNVNLSIAGIGTLTEIGLSCEKNFDGYHVEYVIGGEILGVKSDASWDALEGQPPNVQNGTSFHLNYIGIGQHLALEDNISVLAVDADHPQTIENELARLKTGIRNGMPLKYSEENQILFGLDFMLNDSIHVQGVLNDPSLYGLLVTVKGTAFDGLAVELFYQKVQENIGMFRAELLMPQKYRRFNLGAVIITLGIFSAEIYTNGDFFIDLGFPHENNFSRSFSIEAGQFIGRGGLYFGKLSGPTCKQLPETTNGTFDSAIAIGIGLSLGLKRQFNFGIVKGGLSLEAVGIFEGLFAVFKPNKTLEKSGEDELYFRASATLGLIGTGYFVADLKVAALEFSAAIRAFATVILESYKEMLIILQLQLELRAKLRILFFKINFKFNINQKVEFSMGSDRTELAPWAKKSRERMINVCALRPLEAFPITRNIRNSTAEITLKLLPIFSHEEPKVTIKSRSTQTPSHCVAFVAVLCSEDFEKLEKKLSRWLLSSWQDQEPDWNFSLSLQDVEGITTQVLQQKVTYEALDSFLTNNVSIQTDVPWHVWQDGNMVFAGNNSAVDGAIFPLPPKMQLNYQSMKIGSAMEINEVLAVNDDYLAFLRQYFEKMSANFNQSPRVASDYGTLQTDTLTKAIFEDYFQLILGELVNVLKQQFEEYSFESDNICADCDSMMVDLASVLEDNPDTILNSCQKSVTLPEVTYAAVSTDTLALVAKHCVVDVGTVWKLYQEKTMLPRNGAKFIVKERIHSNPFGYSKETIAALYFVRYFENVITTGYQDLLCILLGENPDMDATWECFDESSVKQIKVYGIEKTWRSLIGDTPERLAKMSMVLQYKDGDNSLWDTFLRNVKVIAKSNKEIIIPQIEITVSDLSLAGLQRRVYFIDDSRPCDEIINIAILQTGYPIHIPSVTIDMNKDISEGLTVSQFMESFGIDKMQLASVVRQENTIIQSGQTFMVRNAKKLSAERLLQHLDAEDVLSHISAFASRFLLQGLRLPHPTSHEVTPFYKLTGQQFQYDKDHGFRFFLSPSKDGTWLKISSPNKWDTIHPDEAKDDIPLEEFNIKSVDGIQQVKEFDKIPKSYVAAQTITVHENNTEEPNKTLHLFSNDAVKEIQNAGNIDLSGWDQSGKAVTEIDWGVVIPITIGKQLDQFVYQVYGTDASQRLLLEKLNQLIKSNSYTTKIRICYQPSPLNGAVENLVMDQYQEENSLLIQTNLSLETHRTAVESRAISKSNLYYANLQETERFLRILWECSVVGGGGYHLRLENQDGEGLPETIFDESARAQLWFLISFKDIKENEKLPLVNCALTRDISVLNETITFRSPQIQTLQPILPVGCVGVRTIVEAPDEEATDAYNRTRNLFSIIGYQINGNEDFESSGDSAPVLPKAVNNEDFIMENTENQDVKKLWKYDPVIPIDKFLKKDSMSENSPPYRAVGKTVEIELKMRDVLGNLANVSGWKKTLEIKYNDLLIGLHEWPGINLSYQFEANPTPGISGNQVKLKVAFTVDSTVEVTELGIAHLQQSLWQIACEDVKLSISNSFSINNKPEDFENSDKNDLLAFGEKLLSYLESKDETLNPKVFVLKRDLCNDNANLPDRPFAFAVYIQLMRSKNCDPSTALAISQIAPSIQAVGNKSGLAAFVENIETLFPTLRVAQGEGENSLYGVTFGPGGFIESISIKPFEKYNSPNFYALCPVGQNWFSGTVGVKELNQDGTLQTSKIRDKTYTHVDLQVWAQRFLEDIEKALSSSYAVRAGMDQENRGKESLQELIEIKKKLAEIIAKQLKSVRKKTLNELLMDMQYIRFMKRRIQDRLARSLKDAFKIDLVAQYKLIFHTKESNKCRLSVSVDPISDMTLQASKAGNYTSDSSMESQTFCLYAVMTGKKKQVPIKDLNIRFEELEYDIQDNDGFESSKWLKFINPIQPKADQFSSRVGISVDLSSQVPWPYLLKNCPEAPSLMQHGMIEDTKDNDLNLLLRWDYSVSWRCDVYEQDILHLQLKEKASSLNEGSETNKLFQLFQAFVQYESIREAIWKKIQKGDNHIFQNAYSTFVQIALMISECWDRWLDPVPTLLSNSDDFQYACDITTHIGSSGASSLDLTINQTDGTSNLDDYGIGKPDIQYVMEGEGVGISGEKAQMNFTITDLPLLKIQSLVPSIHTVRNRSLFGNERQDVAEEFIYISQEMSLPAAYAYRECVDEIELGYAQTEDLNTCQKIVDQLLSGAINLKEKQPMSLSAWYSYPLPEEGGPLPSVKIPTCLLTETEFSRDMKTELALHLKQWFGSIKIKSAGSVIRFNLTVHALSGNKNLLHLSRLLIKII